MKNIIEVIKTNKKAIIKRVVIAGVAAVGLAGLAFVALAKGSAKETLPDGIEVTDGNDEESEEDSDEE